MDGRGACGWLSGASASAIRSTPAATTPFADPALSRAPARRTMSLPGGLSSRSILVTNYLD